VENENENENRIQVFLRRKRMCTNFCAVLFFFSAAEERESFLSLIMYEPSVCERERENEQTSSNRMPSFLGQILPR
jgi:hypothetical protein